MSFRSPIIFAWANKLKKGVRTDALMHSADIPATILDYVGIGRKDNWFLRWHLTDNQVELFDLTKDWRNDIDVAKEFPSVVENLKDLAKTYKAEKGIDPRIAYYQGMKGL